VAAFSDTAAPAAPEFATVAVKVVVPHPLDTEVDSELMPNVGSTSVTTSFTFSGAFNANRYDTDDGAHVKALLMVRMLVDGIGASRAVENVIGVATTSDAPAKATAIVRVLNPAD
jgi:hypothetical protein